MIFRSDSPMTAPYLTRTAREWNPRYLAYCRATGGASPYATLARDRMQYPGGSMCGFILWISRQWRAWRAETGHAGALGPAEHAAFDAWLAIASLT